MAILERRVQQAKEVLAMHIKEVGPPFPASAGAHSVNPTLFSHLCGPTSCRSRYTACTLTLHSSHICLCLCQLRTPVPVGGEGAASGRARRPLGGPAAAEKGKRTGREAAGAEMQRSHSVGSDNNCRMALYFDGVWVPL